MKKEEVSKSALELNKDFLSGYSIGKLLEIDNERLSNAELINRTHDSALYYNNHFEKLLDTLILEELKFIGEYVDNDSLLLFSRGKLESFKKLRAWFEEQEKKVEFQRQQDQELS